MISGLSRQAGMIVQDWQVPRSSKSRQTPLFDRLFSAAIRGEGPIEEVALSIARS